MHISWARHYLTFSISQVISRSQYFSTSSEWYWVQNTAIPYLQWQTDKKSCVIHLLVLFSMISKADFNSTPLFEVKYLRNSTRHRHSYNAVLTRTYTRSYSMV